tara:strand:+ start:260 stop:496 length:237 start_codon:yes stop_codon:yes gene_type:complete
VKDRDVLEQHLLAITKQMAPRGGIAGRGGVGTGGGSIRKGALSNVGGSGSARATAGMGQSSFEQKQSHWKAQNVSIRK